MIFIDLGNVKKKNDKNDSQNSNIPSLFPESFEIS